MQSLIGVAGLWTRARKSRLKLILDPDDDPESWKHIGVMIGVKNERTVLKSCALLSDLN